MDKLGKYLTKEEEDIIASLKREVEKRKERVMELQGKYGRLLIEQAYEEAKKVIKDKKR